MLDHQADELFDKSVYDADGDRIGSVGQVFLTDGDSRPAFVTVHTGLFGLKETFVPLDLARLEGDRIVVPYPKELVKDAPAIEPDGELTGPEQDRLYNYYKDAGQTGDLGFESRNLDDSARIGHERPAVAGAQTDGARAGDADHPLGDYHSAGGDAGHHDYAGTDGRKGEARGPVRLRRHERVLPPAVGDEAVEQTGQPLTVAEEES